MRLPTSLSSGRGVRSRSPPTPPGCLRRAALPCGNDASKGVSPEQRLGTGVRCSWGWSPFTPAWHPTRATIRSTRRGGGRLEVTPGKNVSLHRSVSRILPRRGASARGGAPVGDALPVAHGWPGPNPAPARDRDLRAVPLLRKMGVQTSLGNGRVHHNRAPRRKFHRWEALLLPSRIATRDTLTPWGGDRRDQGWGGRIAARPQITVGRRAITKKPSGTTPQGALGPRPQSSLWRCALQSPPRRTRRRPTPRVGRPRASLRAGRVPTRHVWLRGLVLPDVGRGMGPPLRR